MTKFKKQELFPQVLELLSKNFNQKEIAYKVGVTERTVSSWLKEVKESKANNAKRLKELEIKLKELLSDKTSATEDIKNVTIAIKTLENRWFNKFNK